MKYAYNEKGKIICGTFWLLLGTADDIFIPWMEGYAVDLLLEDDISTLTKLIYFLVVLTLFTGVCSIIRAWIFNILSERISFNIRRDFFEALIGKDIAFFDDDDHRTGELMSRMNSDVEIVQSSLSTAFSSLVRSLVFIIAVLFLLLMISP